MDFYDVLFTLDLDGRFQTVAWGSEEAKKLYHLLFESWVARRRRAASVFPIHAGQESGSFRWDEDTFYYRFLPGPGESS